MSQRPRGENWKSNQEVVTDEKINPKIMMDEEVGKLGKVTRRSCLVKNLFRTA